MPTGTAGLATNELPFQAVNFARRPIAYNSPGIATASTFVVANLPADTMVFRTIIRVTTAFDDTGTDTLIVGRVGDTDELAQTGDSDLTTLGTYEVARGMGVAIAAAKAFHAQYAGQNGNATEGAGYVVVMHCPDIGLQA